MTSLLSRSLKVLQLVPLVCMLGLVTVNAQDRLQLDNLDRLEAKANNSIDVSLDGSLLKLAVGFLNDKKPDEAAIKEAVAGLKGIYVKVFTFTNEGEYTLADVDSVRTQLRSPSWARIAGVKSKREGENLEVFMMTTSGEVRGLAVIATTPKTLYVVNIAGMVDLNKLIKLSGKLGIPSIEITKDDK